MLNNIMITGVTPNQYLPAGYFRDNEAVLTAEEKEAATVKGWRILGVEGGSDTIYTYNLPDTLAPADIGDWAFQAAQIDCTGASGRTWGNGQKGPMEADVTFSAVRIERIDLKVIQDAAKRRAEQAKTESDAYKAQRSSLVVLEAKVKERLAKAQVTESSAKTK